MLDEQTVRYTLVEAQPAIPAGAGRADPLFIYAPAHYLKQFHAKYADKAALDAMVKKAGVPQLGGAAHKAATAMYHNDNPKLPSLDPWVLKTKLPADRIVFERNPYYYRVDGAGHQLPYIDRVVFTIADSKIIPAKTGAGESDLQARYLSFDDYTFLKAGEAANGYQVRLWRTGPGSQLALYPNLNVERRSMAQADPRRALPPRPVAGDRPPRDQPGDLFRPWRLEGQNTVLPQSPLYRPEYRAAWATYDLDQANQLLDQIGLDSRQRRHAPAAGRAAGSTSSSRIRANRREIGCARADPRFVAARRHPAVYQAGAADACSARGCFPARR